jgi:hypothetical protein
VNAFRTRLYTKEKTLNIEYLRIYGVSNRGYWQLTRRASAASDVEKPNTTLN